MKVLSCLLTTQTISRGLKKSSRPFQTQQMMSSFSETPNKKAKTLCSALFQGDDLWDASWAEASGERTLKNRMHPPSDDEDIKFTLYSSWFCPFAQRAWIAAEESGANYQWVEIDPYYVDPSQPGGYTKKAKKLEEKENDFPDFIKASPRGLVPALQANDGTNNGEIVLWESLPVSEYIDAVYGGGKLLKRSDPYSVARQQIWCAHCTDRIQKKYYQALVAQDKEFEKSCIEQFFQECRSLARAMKDDGPYFDGDCFSLVDVALAPFWQRILAVGSFYLGLTLPAEEHEFQRLERWWEAVSKRPSVASTIVCEPRLISTYSDYSKNTATSDAAKNYIK
jgi:glutathione S-transferase